MKTRSRELGSIGENIAVKYLTKHGCRLLCRNFVGGKGEIDIIAEKGTYILFVEVKMRKTASVKPPLAVDAEKRARLLSAAEAFLSEYKSSFYIGSLEARFDVVEVYGENGSFGIEYIENILN